MLYITDAANATLEKKIARLNDIYADCFRDGMDYNTLREIDRKIQKLKAKLGGPGTYRLQESARQKRQRQN